MSSTSVPAVDERADRVPELDPAARVEPGRRLVEQQQPRRADEAGAEVEPAAHAARVGAHEPVGGLGEAELLEHARRRSRVPSAGSWPKRRATISRFSRPVIAGSTAANWPARPISRRTALGLAAHVVAGDAQRAGVGPQQRGDGAHEGRLAGAVRAEHGDDLARARRRGRARRAPASCRSASRGRAPRSSVSWAVPPFCIRVEQCSNTNSVLA